MRHTSVHHGANFDLTSTITFSHRILSGTIQGVKRLKQGIMLWQKVSAGFNKSGIGLDPAGYNGASTSGRGTIWRLQELAPKNLFRLFYLHFYKLNFLKTIATCVFTATYTLTYDKKRKNVIIVVALNAGCF